MEVANGEGSAVGVWPAHSSVKPAKPHPSG